MPLDRIFTAGSLAKMYVEVAEWLGKQTFDMRKTTELESYTKKPQPFSILVPFTGFSRMASAMAGHDVTVETCDYQRLSACIVNGIFKADTIKTNVDKPRFHKGKVFTGELFRGISNQPDEYSAGFIDWVFENGTDVDKACLAMSIPGQTMRGWMGKWTGDFDGLYAKFESTRRAAADFVGMPGAWFHYEADFFKLLNTVPKTVKSHYDVLVVDPPRLSGPTGRDSYSTGAWERLNRVMGGHAKIIPWNQRNYLPYLRQVLDISSDYTLFTWQEGFPRTEDIKKVVCSYGELQDEQVWEGYNKVIYGWCIKRARSW